MLQWIFVWCWNIYVFTFVKPHIKLQEICKNCHSCGKSWLFWVFPNRCIRFFSIVHTKMANFPIFWKNRTEYAEFSEYSADKVLELCNFWENPDYLGFSYQMTVHFAFCLVNILIIWNLLYKIQVVTPRKPKCTDFLEFWQLYTSKIEPMIMDSPPMILMLWEVNCVYQEYYWL